MGRTAELARIHRTAIMPVTIAVTKTKTSIRPLASDTRAGPGQYPFRSVRWSALVSTLSMLSPAMEPRSGWAEHAAIVD